MSRLVSLVVPVYKVEEYLDECVLSITAQTYENIEIILVDDGSPDGCPEICDKWAEKDKRIKVIHKQNGGLSSARNAGIEKADGDYIGFVDSDDIIDRKMIEKLVLVLEKTDKKIVNCGVSRFKTTAEIVMSESEGNTAELNLIGALDGIFHREIDLSVCCKLFEKSVFSHIRFPEGETNEEASVILPMLCASNGIVNLFEPLYYYRKNDQSITSSYWKTDADIVLKNLFRTHNQLLEMGISDLKSFRIYAGVSAFSTALYLDKNYHRIGDTAKQNFKKYLSVMRKLWFKILSSKKVLFKDKILYLMVMTRTLRPIYKIIGKKL